MARITYITIISITFSGTIFGMQEKKSITSNTQLVQRNIQTNTTPTPQTQLAQTPQLPTQIQHNNIALTKTGKCVYCICCLVACKYAHDAYLFNQKYRGNY